MSINPNIVYLIPESWRDSVESSDPSKWKKYHFRKGARNETLYWPDRRTTTRGDLDSIIWHDLSVENTRLSFLPLSQGVQDILYRIKTDVLCVVDTLHRLNTTPRFNKSDLWKREVDSREAEIGVMHVHDQCNIETLQMMLFEMGLKLSDMSHLIMVCRLPEVRTAIDARFKKMWVSEVIVGCDSTSEEGKAMFQNPESNIHMSVAQLVYGRDVVKLDVTYPKPDGEGYAPGHALWVVEEK